MSGEKQGDREAMDRTTKRLIDGGVPPKEADKMARESMRRIDQQQRERGQR